MLIKNAIVLVDEIDTQLAQGQAPVDAVVESGVSRLIPVAMAATPRRVVVVGSDEIVDAYGRRTIEDELRGIGARKVEFRHEAFALARGALEVGRKTPRTLWRRVARS